MKSFDSERGTAQSIESLELILSRSLRLGVIVCALLIGIGVLLGLVSQGGHDPALRESLIQLVRSQTVDKQLPHAWQGFGDLIPKSTHSSTFIALGLVLLILLPVIRVSLTLLMFWLNRDFFYVGVTLIVLIGLLGGLLSVRQMKHSPILAKPTAEIQGATIYTKSSKQ